MTPSRATAVDANGLLPIRLLEEPCPSAAVFRGYLHKHARQALEAAPQAHPLARAGLSVLVLDRLKRRRIPNIFFSAITHRDLDGIERRFHMGHVHRRDAAARNGEAQPFAAKQAVGVALLLHALERAELGRIALHEAVERLAQALPGLLVEPIAPEQPHQLFTAGGLAPRKQLTVRAGDKTFQAIARLAHDHGLWFHIDGAQSAGMIPIDLHAIGCDSFATSGHKWMGGPHGTGLLYVRQDKIKDLWPMMAAPEGKEADIRKWRAAKRRKARGRGQVPKAYRLMRAVLNTAVKDKLIRENPCPIDGAGQQRLASAGPTAN